MDEEQHESASRSRPRQIYNSYTYDPMRSWSWNRHRERAMRPYEMSWRTSQPSSFSSSSSLLSSPTPWRHVSSSAASRDDRTFAPIDTANETQMVSPTSSDAKQKSPIESPESYNSVQPWKVELFEALQQSQSLPSDTQPIAASIPNVPKSQEMQHNHFNDQQDSSKTPFTTASYPRLDQLSWRLRGWFDQVPRSTATTTLHEQPLPESVVSTSSMTNSQAPHTATSQARSKSWQNNVTCARRKMMVHRMVTNLRKTHHIRRCKQIINEIEKEVFNTASSAQEYMNVIVSRCASLANEQKAISPNLTNLRDRAHSLLNYPYVDSQSINQNSSSNVVAPENDSHVTWPRDETAAENSRPSNNPTIGSSGVSPDFSLSYFENIFQNHYQPVSQPPNRPSASSTSSSYTSNSILTSNEPRSEPCLTSPWHTTISSNSNSNAAAPVPIMPERAALALQRINRIRLEIWKNLRDTANSNNSNRASVLSRRERFVNRITNLRTNLYYSDYEEPFTLAPESRLSYKSVEFHKILAVANILKMNWNIYGMKRLPGHLRCSSRNCNVEKPCIHRRLANSVLKHEAAASA
ncbi:uncharacterized protein LOC106643533 [Copidosoma floridanum]|uniref:uncharacterized protein LOC106643533 n=1 Tax=Copidosoma floridanum TaxID=29053 RepID=UPI0006C95FBA|nr:uncharacterized protein LOC106643533 [Copidosoma floridanum]